MRSKVLKKYRDEIDGKHQWLIVAAASPKWAKKVFPDDDSDTAVENSGTQFSPAFILTAIKTGSRCGNSIPIL